MAMVSPVEHSELIVITKNGLMYPAQTPIAIRNGNVQAKQRELERRVRKYKANADLAKKLGDADGQQHYKQLISNNQAALRQIVKDHDFLSRDYSREKVFL